jgi:hypothetical protein
VDPRVGGDWQAELRKLQPLLDPTNVRRNTPLDVITNHLWEELKELSQSDLRISYVLLTDGQPNDNKKFENSLRNLANAIRVDGLQGLFLTINLCTDEDKVVDYYNDLDQKLGSELSGMDVLDDFESELKEVQKVGNTFITYTEELHICRMAGCNSVLGDLLDEKRLSAFYMVKLVRELLRLDFGEEEEFDPEYDESAWMDDTEGFLRTVKRKNPQVWNFQRNKFTPLVDVPLLHKEINRFKNGNSISDKTFSVCKWAAGTLLLLFFAMAQSESAPLLNLS